MNLLMHDLRNSATSTASAPTSARENKHTAPFINKADKVFLVVLMRFSAIISA